MDTIDGQEINEDDQEIYCINRSCGSLSRKRIPKYSQSLWKECLQLLKTNTTLTELSIGHYECRCYDGTKKLNQQLIDDLLDSLSNNKSIKTLYLDFQGLNGLKKRHPIINVDFISSLLQNNTTIESLYIGSEDKGEWEKPLFNDIVNSKPSSSKCFIGYAPKMPMSSQFSSKAYE
ncbi:hypothetical protein CYY_006508 [Polysphondylium violaceum]|uniref:Uncharacterized protein n=1 Tax=Polysphondylium violaceum TaxID=133409 RepID=A0A8J4PR96_9MYCE|nr:hypothetical protein CYY_006508 [Polysphondylium violaceum]